MTLSQQRAFSLIEILITLIITSIVFSIATPSLSSAIQSSKQTIHTNQMIGALNYARNKAITSKRMVSLCAGSTSCNNATQWEQQIIIFIDINQDGQFNQTDTLLNTLYLDEIYSWHWSNFRNQKHMSYKPDGTTHSLNGTFTLCMQHLPTRSIVINTSGRARIAAPTNANACTT